MAGRIVLLGTGTCQIEPGRAATAALIELEALRVLYDFGRGVADRLAGLGLRQDDLRHVVLSHFHPDHFSDLIPYLQAASYSKTDPRSADLAIYGPRGLVSLIEGLLETIGRRLLVAEDRFGLALHEVGPGELVIEEVPFSLHDLPPAGNQGLRLEHRGRLVALTGDSGFHPQAIEFVRGADLAVIDAGHLEDREIVELAAAAGPRRLVCSHLYRDLDAGALEAAARSRGFTGRLLVARDLMSFEI